MSLLRKTSAAQRPSVDLLSPPFLLGASYVTLYVFNAIDIFIEQEWQTDLGWRLRQTFIDYFELSGTVLLYLLVGYLLFLWGYRLRVGKAMARLVHLRPSRLEPLHASLITTAMFTGTFALLVLYTLQVGYGRYQGSGTHGLENLSILGEMSLIPYALGLYRFMLSKRLPDYRISTWDKFFLWGVMAPLQIGLSVFIGVRTRLAMVLLIALAAYHYGWRQMRLRSLALLGVLVFGVIMPVTSLIRVPAEMRPDFKLTYVWDSIVARNSALEGFTVTFNDLDKLDEPDPLWLMVASGLIPRIIWKDKPISVSGEHFSQWACGRPLAGLAPSLPGEMLLHFGYLGGLAAMVALGIFWRALYEVFTSPERLLTGATFVYLNLLPILLTTEVGFVIPYSTFIRYLVVGLLVFMMVRTSPAPQRACHGGISGEGRIIS